MKINKTMEQSKMKVYNSYDSNILDALFLKYGLSKYYIRQSIRGAVRGITPDSIRNDYNTMKKAHKDVVRNFIQTTLK